VLSAIDGYDKLKETQGWGSMKNNEYLTTKEIATELRVKEQTVWRWIKTGKLIGYKIGREFRIRRSDYEQFLKQQRQKLPPDIQP